MKIKLNLVHIEYTMEGINYNSLSNAFNKFVIDCIYADLNDYKIAIGENTTDTMYQFYDNLYAEDEYKLVGLKDRVKISFITKKLIHNILAAIMSAVNKDGDDPLFVDQYIDDLFSHISTSPIVDSYGQTIKNHDDKKNVILCCVISLTTQTTPNNAINMKIKNKLIMFAKNLAFLLSKMCIYDRKPTFTINPTNIYITLANMNMPYIYIYNFKKPIDEIMRNAKIVRDEKKKLVNY